MAVSTVAEAASISLIFPLLQLAIAPTAVTGLPIIGNVLESLDVSGQKESLMVLLAAFSVGFLIRAALTAFLLYYRAFLVADVRSRMSDQLLRAYSRKPWEEHIFIKSSDAVYDIAITGPNVISGIFMPFLGILLEMCIVLGVTVALLVFQPLVSVFAIGSIGAILGLFYIVVRLRVSRLGAHLLTNIKAISYLSRLCMESSKENKILGRERRFFDEMGRLTGARARLSAALDVINQLPRVVGEVAILVAILGTLAIFLVRDGSLETALPVLGFLGVAAFRILPSANKIVNYAAALRGHLAPLDAVYQELQDAVRLPEKMPARVARDHYPFSREVRLERVSYRYPNTSDWTVRDVDLVIRKGQSVAIVGRSGAGKTTLVDIVLGLLPPTEGQVLLDNRKIEQFEGFWGDRVGYVPQNIFLADDTLRRNIAFGLADEEIDEARIREVVAAAHLENVIRDLEAGLDTTIGEKGVRISGGQRQRIGIARALYHRPQILVLDEATSALDNETEQEITRAIESLSGKVTLIVIAHRLSTVRKCDVLVMMKEGRIADVGDFETLRGRNVDFRRLVEMSSLERPNVA